MAMKTIKEVLIEARALIADPARWTQGEFARTADGRILDGYCEGAVCWCALGAIRKVTMEGAESREERTEALVLSYDAADLLQAHLANVIAVPKFNDSHTHEEVLALFDKAIGREQNERAENV